MGANPHSPEELAQLSTLIHHIMGWLFVALAIVRLSEALRGETTRPSRFVWPAIGAVAGLGLTAYIFFHQVFYHELSPFADPVQNQHELIGLAIGIGATVEVLRRRATLAGRFAESAWPLALVAVGLIFLWHEQGDFKALIVHWALAATIIVSGFAEIAAALAGEGSRAMRIFAILLLFGAAAQLVAYKEDPGAHAGHGAPAPAPAHDGH